MDVQQLFRDGDLTGAIAAQQDEVKARPTDAGARTFLFELLAFAGDLERATKQLAVIGSQDIERDAIAQTYRNLLLAESQRRRVFHEGIEPQFFLDVPADVQPHLAALQSLRGGQPAEAMSLISDAEDGRDEIAGRLNDAEFTGLRDADDVLAPILELILGPEYYWVPWSQINQLEVAPPKTPRDLLWPACQVILGDGTVRRGHVSALYPDSHTHEDDKIRLGQQTDWIGADGEPVRGVGRKVLLAGDADVTLFEIRMLRTAGAETEDGSADDESA